MTTPKRSVGANSITGTEGLSYILANNIRYIVNNARNNIMTTKNKWHT